MSTVWQRSLFCRDCGEDWKSFPDITPCPECGGANVTEFTDKPEEQPAPPSRASLIAERVMQHG